jgi:hypothetical protein
MKKMMLTLAIAISTLSAFAVEEKVSPKVLDAFKNEFNTAKEVEWTVGNTYYMATFTYNDKYVFAYYTVNGILLGLSHYISPAELPMALQNNLKKNYNDYWVSDLFEVAKNGKTEYYVTLENADRKIVLQSSGSNEWEEYRKVRKV